MDSTIEQEYLRQINNYEAFADSIAKLEKRAVDQILVAAAGPISLEYYKLKAATDILRQNGVKAKNGGFIGIEAIARAEYEQMNFLNTDGKYKYMTEATTKEMIFDETFENLRISAENLGRICGEQLSNIGLEMHIQMGKARESAFQMKKNYFSHKTK